MGILGNGHPAINVDENDDETDHRQIRVQASTINPRWYYHLQMK
jgi:hypothetical protein